MFNLPGLWKNGTEVHMSKKRYAWTLHMEIYFIHKIRPNCSLLQQIFFSVFHSAYQKYAFQK